jgi:hypothetical protein
LRQSGSGLLSRPHENQGSRGLPVLGFAVAGLVLGHILAYVIAVPDPSHRDLLLQRTGHDYLPAFGQAALMIFLAAVAAVVFRMSRRRAERPERFATLAAQLALIQVGAFTAQELLERTVSGSGFADLGRGRVLVVGVMAQIAVALVGAALLRSLARASKILGEIDGRAAPLPRHTPAFPISVFAGAASGRDEVASPGQRAPPSA